MKRLIILTAVIFISINGFSQQQPPKRTAAQAIALQKKINEDKKKEAEKRNQLKHKADSAYQLSATKIKLPKSN